MRDYSATDIKLGGRSRTARLPGWKSDAGRLYTALRTRAPLSIDINLVLPREKQMVSLRRLRDYYQCNIQRVGKGIYRLRGEYDNQRYIDFTTEEGRAWTPDGWAARITETRVREILEEMEDDTDRSGQDDERTTVPERNQQR